MQNTLSKKATAVLSQWSAVKPGFALMGEYSAGKSTLLNMLLGQALLPTKVTATHLPTVWITYGTERRLDVLAYDGTLTEVSEDGLDFMTLHEYLAVRFTLPAEILRQSDIIDTPGISDPNLKIDVVGLISQHIDFVVWCTAANQAWRQTEKSAWLGVKNDVQDQSLLAVTRSDQLANTKDLSRVISRCEREAGKYFHGILPVSAKLARTPGEGNVINSGAAALLNAIAERVDSAATYRAERKARQGDEVPEFEEESETISPDDSGDFVDTKPIVERLAASISDATDITSNDQFFALFDHLKNNFRDEIQASDPHTDVIDRLLSVRGHDDSKPPAAIKQVQHEINDFSEGPWCRLNRVKEH